MRNDIRLLKIALRSMAWRSTAFLPLPPGEPRVVVNGPNPYRLLLVGSGIMCGVGVRSHQLALAGHLARGISRARNRGVEVDVDAVPDLQIGNALTHLAVGKIAEYDAVLLSVGLNDAVSGTTRSQWSLHMKAILKRVESVPTPMRFFLLEIADPRDSPLFRPVPARVAAARARAFNAETRRLLKMYPGITPLTYSVGPVANDLRIYDSASYAAWAKQLLPAMLSAL